MRRVSQEIDFQSEQILETAIQLFCEKGFTKTRMEDIANILNISKTPLYYHFKDKAGLFDAAYRKAIDGVYNNDKRIFSKNCSLYEKLIEAFMVCAVSSHQLQISEMSRIMVKEKESLPNTVKYMDEMNDVFYKFKTDIMREAKENGEIKENVDIDELYSIINASYVGVLDWIEGVDRRNKMNDSEKEALATQLLGRVFEAIKPIYFN